MTLEPLRLAVVPLLEAAHAPPQIDGYPLAPQPDLQWRADRPIAERVRFSAEAYSRFGYGPLRAPLRCSRTWSCRAGYNPRTLAWAAALQRELGPVDARHAAQAVLQHIRDGGYSYTLAPGGYGRDAIDEFWLDRRDGFCEHFAAAFVVVMRALGVPARIVTGYQGTDPLPVDGYYLVRQSSAHAWAEYWQPGAGWLRADPTAAVAPDRIERSRRLAPPLGLMAGALGNVSPALLEQLRDAWEVVNNRWNQWVLNYSRGQQLDVLKHLGFRAPSPDDLLPLLIAALSALALAAAGWAWWDRNRIDPWARQMMRLHRALASLAVPAAPHEAPRALAARVRQRLGAAGEPLAASLEALERQRYGRASLARPDPALTRRFVAQARALRQARKACREAQPARHR